MCNCQNNCGCSQTTVEYNLCNPCPPEPCTCPVEITTNCITLAEDLSCSGVSAGTNFTEAIQQLDEFVCDALSQLGGTTTLINVGDGAEVYKGIDGLGRREIKSITSSGGIIITENIDTIELNVTGAETKLIAGTNTTISGVGTIASPYIVNSIGADGSETKINSGTNISVTGSGTQSTPYIIENTMVVDGSETKLINGTNTTVTGVGTIASPYQIAVPTVDGTETKINAGSNVTVAGNGSTATPYVINSTATAAATVINSGTNISVTGSGTVGSPYVIANTLTVDGSETKINSGVTTTVTGNGTIGTPYVLETVNLQKAITGDYTLLASDNNYSIKVNNSVTSVTITVPSGLPENFFIGITQKGAADVTFLGSGTSITNPIGLKIKGQGYHVGLEQIGATNSFDLLGFTKA